jgi:hypothetical protein
MSEGRFQEMQFIQDKVSPLYGKKYTIVKVKNIPTSKHRSSVVTYSWAITRGGNMSSPNVDAATPAACTVSRMYCQLNAKRITTRYNRPTAAMPLSMCNPKSPSEGPKTGINPAAAAAIARKATGQSGTERRMAVVVQLFTGWKRYFHLQTLHLGKGLLLAPHQLAMTTN